MKKINLLCRPDHSSMIVNYQESYKDSGIEIDAHMFNAAHPNSLLKSIVGKITEVPKEVDVSYMITILEHINRLLVARNIDSGSIFYKICDLIYSRKMQRTDGDLLHIWPMYAYGDWVRSLQRPILLDCYEANPLFVESIYRREYERCSIEYDSKRLFRHEHNYNTLQQPGRIIAPSKYVVDSYKGHIDAEKFYINPYGLLGHRFSKPRNKQKNKKKVFTFLGRACLEKGVAKIFEAAVRLSGNNNIVFKIVGPVDRNVKKVFSYYNLPNVEFVGPVAKNNVKRYLEESDFFIMPSLSDAYCIAVIEALSVGLPVIVSNRTGCCDIVKDNGLGKVVDIDSQSELEAAIVSMSNMSNVSYLEVQNRIESYFEREGDGGYQKRLIDIYNEIVNNGG
ncbi:glycosyltransferase [Vibrio mediterranei]|uniref:glycosyltransferase n=1 Tax=Vibrio mediterranei TaxID=689 RepID=UPI004067663A